MPSTKVSLSLDEELVDEARRMAGARGLSGYVNRALGHELQRERVARYLEELDEEHGPIAADVLREVRREWPAPTD